MDNKEKKMSNVKMEIPQNDLIEFTIENTTKNVDENSSSDIGKKMVDDISSKIIERFNAENKLPEIQENPDETSTLPWETIIGVSVGLLLIVGFILMLYYNSG